MDSLIPSFVPQAGAPAASAADALAGSTAPAAGSSAELAGLFADLVASFGVPVDPETELSGGAGETAEDLDVDEGDLDDDGMLPEAVPVTPWQAPVMPWAWTIEPAVHDSDPGDGAIEELTPIEASASQGAALEGAVQISSTDAQVEPDAIERAFDQAQTPESPAAPISGAPGQSGRDEPAPMAAPPSTLEHGAGSTPVQPDAQAVPAANAKPDGMSPAARALAKTLAALDGEKRPAATDGSSAVPAKARSAHGPSNPELMVKPRPDTAAPELAQAGPAMQIVNPTVPGVTRTADLLADDGRPSPAIVRASIDAASGLSMAAGADSGVMVRSAAGAMHAANDQDLNAQFEASAAELMARADAEAADVSGQIVKAMRVQLKGGVGEVRLQLRPEHLGEVRIEIKVEGQRVNASIQAERQDVRQYIESQSQTLRSALGAQGLELDQLNVRDQESSRREHPQEEPRRQPSRRHQQRESEKEFEIPV